MGGKHRLQIARGDLPAPDALVQHHGIGTVGQQRDGAGGFQRAAGAERLEPGGLLAGQIAQPRGADGPQMGRDHQPAAPGKDRNFQRGFHRRAHRVGKSRRCYAEDRGKQGIVALAQPHPGVASLGAHRPDTIDHSVADQQHRHGVFPAKGCQTGEFLHVGQRQLRELHRGVQFQFRRTRARRMLGRPGVDGLAESGQLFFLNFHTGGRRMPAKAGQILGAASQRTVQVERVGRTAAAASLSILQRDDDGGAVVLFHQPRGHNADNAGMPVLAGDHQYAVPLAGRVGFQRLLGGSEHFLFRLLALGVDLRQAGGNAGGLGFIGAKQQL